MGRPTPEVLRLAASAAIALAWVPLLVRFYRAWRGRGNPISLAIALVVVMAAYAPTWLAGGPGAPWSWSGLAVVDSLCCAFFYAALIWARQRFPDARDGRKGR